MGSRSSFIGFCLALYLLPSSLAQQSKFDGFSPRPSGDSPKIVFESDQKNIPPGVEKTANGKQNFFI
jgi:hypothetical protein